METTFISIHDLSEHARVLYASQSIGDILGHSPEDVVGTSAFDYFHPEEVPFARAKFGRGVQLDRAAVLSYCRVRGKDDRWIGCECCFTIVHDVLVASTSIYRRGMRSELRAAEAPIIRRLFSSSPRDPRYHMLSHLSAKFSQPPAFPAREARAALFLNRFSRTLTIMYATQSIAQVFGFAAEEAIGKSFYYCIQQNCLQDAIRCLESAKANDSIAYLRFWFRDPRQDVQTPEEMDQSSQPDADSVMTDQEGDDDEEEDGGVSLDHNNHMLDSGNNSDSSNSRSNSDSNKHIFENQDSARSSSSSLPLSDQGDPLPNSAKTIEIEAVVSCTSDGLVVVLRRARPVLPTADVISPPFYTNGLFASPWAIHPIIPPPVQVSQPFTAAAAAAAAAATDPFYRQCSLPQPHQAAAPPVFAYPQSSPLHHQQQQHQQAARGPPPLDFMKSIRDVAAFTWSLTGINGSLARYGRGTPSGEAQPPGGMPVWVPDSVDRDRDQQYDHHHDHHHHHQPQHTQTQQPQPPSTTPNSIDAQGHRTYPDSSTQQPHFPPSIHNCFPAAAASPPFHGSSNKDVNSPADLQARYRGLVKPFKRTSRT